MEIKLSGPSFDYTTVRFCTTACPNLLPADPTMIYAQGTYDTLLRETNISDTDRVKVMMGSACLQSGS